MSSIHAFPVRAGPVDPAAAVPNFAASARQLFRQRYNRTSFLFAHALADNPLFDLSSILALANRRSQNPTYAHWSNGKVSVDDSWDAGQGARYSLPETIADIRVNNSLVLLKHVEKDSVFESFMREILATVLDLAGPRLRDDVVVGRGTILLASPGRLTSYHIDADVNYLFQIAGNKSISVLDQSDRSVTTHEELENYFSGNPNGAVFKKSCLQDAPTYDLRAGYGVHIPCMAAHWAQNHATTSVALSVNFDLRSMLRLRRIYQLNGTLRRRGLCPTPPGVSAWCDRLKVAASRGLGAARRIMRRRAAAPAKAPTA